MTSNIHNLLDHPNRLELQRYYDAPDGEWTGTLVDRAWDINRLDGKPLDLFCYFREATGAHHRLTVHRDAGFKPSPKSPSFLDAPLGGRYKIRSRVESEAPAAFINAALV